MFSIVTLIRAGHLLKTNKSLGKGRRFTSKKPFRCVLGKVVSQLSAYLSAYIKNESQELTKHLQARLNDVFARDVILLSSITPSETMYWRENVTGGRALFEEI